MFAVLLFVTLIALTSAFVPNFGRFATKAGSSCLYSECQDKLKDAKGKCPGDTGYIPLLKEAPTDFAAYQAEQKAKKAAAAKTEGRCPEKALDAKGRCPGDTGYVPLMKEAPVDFAAYQAQLKAKKAAEGK